MHTRCLSLSAALCPAVSCNFIFINLHENEIDENENDALQTELGFNSVWRASQAFESDHYLSHTIAAVDLSTD